MSRRIYMDLPDEAVACIQRTVEALKRSGKTVTFDQVASTLLVAGSAIVVSEIDEESRNVRKPAEPEKKIGDMTAGEFHAVMAARYDGKNMEADREKITKAMRDALGTVQKIAVVSGPHIIDRAEWDNFKHQVEHQFSHCQSHRLALIVGWTDEHNEITSTPPMRDPGAN